MKWSVPECIAFCVMCICAAVVLVLPSDSVRRIEKQCVAAQMFTTNAGTFKCELIKEAK